MIPQTNAKKPDAHHSDSWLCKGAMVALFAFVLNLVAQTPAGAQAAFPSLVLGWAADCFQTLATRSPSYSRSPFELRSVAAPQRTLD